MKLELNGKWLFKQADDSKWLDAKVPGCNFLDLIENKIISDPFYGTNEKDCYWIGEKDWSYKRNFTITNEQYAFDKLLLVFKMLDTLATITINGNVVASTDNCHIEHSFDIKEFVKIGDNTIEILFPSPVAFVLAEQAKEKCPANNNGLNGIPHIRKPQCHFGWDWGPVLTPSGISGDVFIQCVNASIISDFKIKQYHNNGDVSLSVDVAIDNFSSKDVNCNVSIISPLGDSNVVSGVATQKCSVTSNITDPQIWSLRELNGLDKQPLYTITVTIEQDGVVLDTVSKKIGLRTISLNRSVDEFGQNFQFVVNGAPIFAKGANWIPADSFINAFDRKKLEFYIKSAAECNFNMIRVWGGGYYESDDFYDLCDEYGVLVWQDFAFACQPYPFFMEEFTANVKREVAGVVKRIRDHASLCLWCGNNEIELMAIAWKLRTNYVKWTEKFFWEMLPEILAPYDDVTPYIAGTPIGTAHNKGFGNDNVGDTHLWAVWHGLQPMTYYRKRMTRFCSEFGFESLPDLKTVKTFAEEKDYSLTSPVFSSHQKCNSGNMKMAYYIALRFALPEKFEDYIYLSQICQQECIRDATEHWRRYKGQCNGSLFWQYNDCWPVCSWASIDYYGNFKALQYTSKHFFAPVMVSFEDTKKKIDVYAINDKLVKYDTKVCLQLITFDGKVAWTKEVECKLEQNSSQKVTSIATKELKQRVSNIKSCVLVADMYVDGVLVSNKKLLFDKEKNINLLKCNIGTECAIDGDEAVYTITSDKFARLVQVYTKTNYNPLSDNYFDILANGSVEIRQTMDKEYTVDELLSNVTVTSVVDIQPKGSKFSDFMLRVKVFMTPINFFNWIYYNKIPGKIKVNKDK